MKEAILIMTAWNKLSSTSAEYSGSLVTLIRKSIPDSYIYKGLKGLKEDPKNNSAAEHLMHNKFMILSRDNIPYAIITGSYNYTNKAVNNRENIVYVEDPEVAQAYMEEFNAILKESSRL